MRPGYNSQRRNRNIGTNKQGHGQDNRQAIPSPRNQLRHFEKIGAHRQESRAISGKLVNFLVEETRSDFVHACTVEDVAHLLRVIPDSDWAGLNTIIFRCPTRKQAIINPVWGRLLYCGEVSTAKGQIVADGPMIMLEAVQLSSRLQRPTGQALDAQDEFLRLIADGHRFERCGNRFTATAEISACRTTQLFRTVLHEIGHWFDWLEKVEGPAARGEEYELLCDSYFARPSNEREAFAHRYADELKQELIKQGVIPF